jgi:predicted O-methyltransferase YrrM
LEWISGKAVDYSAAFSSPEDELLAEISAHTLTSHPEPGMLSGQVQGKFLQMISCMIRPQRVLEIGTMTGYSAICLAEGLAEGGMLHTVELRENDAVWARANISRSRHGDRIIVHTGDALSCLSTLQGTWDLVFIDADKVNYIRYYEAVLPSLRPGGFILADNVLFHGEVLEDQPKGKNARAIHAFNSHVRSDARVEHVLLTVRDGLMLIRKK